MTERTTVMTIDLDAIKARYALVKNTVGCEIHATRWLEFVWYALYDVGDLLAEIEKLAFALQAVTGGRHVAGRPGGHPGQTVGNKETE